MFSDAIRLARHYWYVSIVVVLVGAFALLSARDASGSSPLVTMGETAVGVLEIDGVEYDFAPQTCTIGNDSFVGAGRGSKDGEPYWVSSSPSMIDIVFGITEETEAVPDDGEWLSSLDEVHWAAADDAVEAGAELIQHGEIDSATHTARLHLVCPPG